ncbi:hypothetical protein GALMADRAFT_445568 [Galerina marginata CBS 339.88]|uniref:RING-type domain-containing protein n=1 Tax=Galerina marginata (strain CBS 339.88) TaxID=685588 RepID=A0A067T021_GALM3|nr:hypothetical protein GALMADRAFT_445568 [Galerina marginata CBS 339.88]
MSYSVPTSPAMSRSTKAQPVTPQRLPRQQSRSQSFYRSPLTPSASPYTPISLRSLDSTGSSTLTTPDNIGSGVKKRLAFSAGSPDVMRNVSATQDKSLADIAENWRSRANENGIKVAFAPQDDSHYVADDSSDMSFSDVANDSSLISTDEALLAAPFSSTHRRLNSLPITNRPRAQSHASLPSSRIHPLSPVTSRANNHALQTSSPIQSRRTLSSSFAHSANLMSTPPPNRTLAKQLKLKGSLTDPAQPRRREAFSAVATPSYNIGHRNASMSLTLEPDTSLNLFDIDENDFEYEHDSHGPGFEVENSFSRNLQAIQNNNFSYPTFASHQQALPQVFNQSHFGDPFQPINTRNGLFHGHILNGITESVEHHFHAARPQPPQKTYYDDRQQAGNLFYNPVSRPQPQFNQGMPHAYPTPAFVPVPQPSLLPFQPSMPVHPRLTPDFSSNDHPATPDPAPTDCSVCLASQPTSLAILHPCKHSLCSACLTSALNIVGEKDMECAVCKQAVADFKLVVGSSRGNKSPGAGATLQGFTGETPKNDTHQGSQKANASADQSNLAGKSFMDPLFSTSSGSSKAFERVNPDDSVDELESAFEFGLEFDDLRASTPKLEQQLEDQSVEERSRHYTSLINGRRDVRKGEDNVVLRIDNVPWDITPHQIIKWLQQPVERVHVLLDGKGKTLSHAYVEVKDAATAGAILRGEALSSMSGRKERGSVLGRGRRARGVTVTRSGQQELMSDLFPHWRGGFDGSRPSLAGLHGDRIIGALEGGLLTEHEILGLLHLIREPDSHFLKVPSLPFHSLISILSKFPVDVDSRVFWSASVRDALFDATFIAITMLLPRVLKAQEKPKAPGQEEEYTMDVALSLLHTALDCKAFTIHQIQRLTELAQTSSLPLPVSDADLDIQASPSSSFSVPSALRTPPIQDISISAANPVQLNRPLVHDNSDSSLEDLAKEFGVDTQVVQALAQRLAKLC